MSLTQPKKTGRVEPGVLAAFTLAALPLALLQMLLLVYLPTYTHIPLGAVGLIFPFLQWIGFRPDSLHNSTVAIHGLEFCYVAGPSALLTTTFLAMRQHGLEASQHARLRRLLADQLEPPPHPAPAKWPAPVTESPTE